MIGKINEKKRCCLCQNVINYGLHAVKAECKITHQVWSNYTSEDNDRHNAENCEYFSPPEKIWSNSTQKMVKSLDINWI